MSEERVDILSLLSGLSSSVAKAAVMADLEQHMPDVVADIEARLAALKTERESLDQRYAANEMLAAQARADRQAAETALADVKARETALAVERDGLTAAMKTHRIDALSLFQQRDSIAAGHQAREVAVSAREVAVSAIDAAQKQKDTELKAREAAVRRDEDRFREAHATLSALLP